VLYRGAERDPQSRFHALLAETKALPRAEFDGEVEWIAADSSDPDDFLRPARTHSSIPTTEAHQDFDRMPAAGISQRAVDR
jgi:hypothetical protein